MDEQEKNQIYQQMNMILNEIQQLMTFYESWKVKLFGTQIDRKSSDFFETKSLYGREVENQKYLSSKGTNSTRYDYQCIALKITSLLKESGRSLSTKEIYQELYKEGYVLKHSNLSNNILRKMNLDAKINVERAYRGYWQYHLSG